MRRASFFVARNSEKRLSGAVFNCLTSGFKQKSSKYYFGADYYEAGLCIGPGDRFLALGDL